MRNMNILQLFHASVACYRTKIERKTSFVFVIFFARLVSTGELWVLRCDKITLVIQKGVKTGRELARIQLRCTFNRGQSDKLIIKRPSQLICRCRQMKILKKYFFAMTTPIHNLAQTLFCADVCNLALEYIVWSCMILPFEQSEKIHCRKKEVNKVLRDQQPHEDALKIFVPTASRLVKIEIARR